MLRGNVNAQREAIVPIDVRDCAGRHVSLEAVIDTGFNGYLSLPTAIISNLGLLFVFQSKARLADGTEVSLNVFEAVVVWDGTPTAVEVDAVEGAPLVGMALLQGFDLRIRAIPGGEVEIERIP